MLNAILEKLTQSHQQPRILIVDDQAMNIRALHELFKDEYDLLMATDGEHALRQARTQKPDLILLDIVMPDMSGLDVCRTLKEDPATAEIPIIFVTASADETEEVQGFELGAVDFIVKPINPVITRARVRTQLALKLQYDFMRNVALMDGLTGVGNRRRFDEEFRKGWRLCQRETRPMSLIMIDVDHFKRYNDSAGHLAGDECLRSIATTLQKTLRRPHDLLCRYGGEEFAALLPFTDSAGAIDRAQVMLQAIVKLGMPHPDPETGDLVTISLGVATMVPTPQCQREQLIDCADKALYRSKRSGRARYSVYAAEIDALPEPSQDDHCAI